eukprot:jgi/Tetstr1/425775/TSEL_001560.t1
MDDPPPAAAPAVPTLLRKAKPSGGLAGMLGPKKRPPPTAPAAPRAAAAADTAEQRVGKGAEGAGPLAAVAAVTRPRCGGGSALSRALGGGARGTAASLLAEVKASMQLPFSLVPLARATAEAAPTSELVTSEPEVVGGGDSAVGDAAAEEPEQTVSEWLQDQRVAAGRAPGSGAAEEEEGGEEAAAATPSKPKREFEEYLPLSLSERYSKRAPGTGMTAQQHLGAEMAAKQREGRGGAAAAVTPFDYGASAAERPALSGALQPQLAGSKWRQAAGRGRGRGGRGRGGPASSGRGGGRAPAAPAGPRKGRLAAHEMADGDLLKGGKRSAAFPRSGNRSGTFK